MGVALPHVIEDHFQRLSKAFHLDTIQVPGASLTTDGVHCNASLLISRATNTADFLFVSGLLLPNHNYIIADFA